MSVADLVSLTRDPSGLKPFSPMAMLAMAGAFGGAAMSSAVLLPQLVTRITQATCARLPA